MTIIETAKRNGLDVYGYLLYLLTALPALGKNPSEESLIPLLPWSDSLPDYCKAAFSEIQELELFGVTCTCSWLELFVVIWSWVKNDAAPFLGVGGLVGGYE